MYTRVKSLCNMNMTFCLYRHILDKSRRMIPIDWMGWWIDGCLFKNMEWGRPEFQDLANEEEKKLTKQSQWRSQEKTRKSELCAPQRGPFKRWMWVRSPELLLTKMRPFMVAQHQLSICLLERAFWAIQLKGHLSHSLLPPFLISMISTFMLIWSPWQWELHASYLTLHLNT